MPCTPASNEHVCPTRQEQLRSLKTLAPGGLVHTFIPIQFSREEHAIALSSNLCKDGRRRICRVGYKFEALLMRRPANGCRVFNVIADELVRVVADLDASRHSTPTDAEGDVCWY